MCAIAGIFHLDTAKPVAAARVRAMTDVQAHRGPDGSGVWTARGVGLGHRRLAIIDLAGSPQPMHDASGQLTISYNGEVYNYREVRTELTALGHAFRTEGDTEVILAAYRQWGPEALARLNGMFAFAIHDARDASLFLARDRLGVKPLHYAPLPDGSIAFASELKGLLAHPALRREPSPQAIEDYFALGYVPDDACIVAGVRKLPAGSWLKLRRGMPLPAPVEWWNVDFSARASGSAAALEDEMRSRLRDAVTSRMVADVPVGAFLSGGVDSSTVVALMAETSRQAVQTCSIGFDSAALDETHWAAIVAKRFATDHRSGTVAPDDFSAIDRLTAAFDEPFADASALPTWRVAQLARESVTVALSGDGADEVFAGYRRHRFQVAEDRVRAVLPVAGQRLLGRIGAIYPRADRAPRWLRAKATLEGIGRDGGEAYARAVGVTPPEMRARLFSSRLMRDVQGHRAEDRTIAAMAAAPAQGALDRAQYADLKVWLPGDILTKVDRTSMAVGLEAREPLLDHRLVEFGARLPTSMRLRSGEGKWLMKRAMRGVLPDEVLYRPKMGFVTPVSDWFRGALANEARAVAGRLGATGWFAPAALLRVVDEHRAGKRDYGRLIWQFVMFDKAMARVFGQ